MRAEPAELQHLTRATSVSPARHRRLHSYERRRPLRLDDDDDDDDDEAAAAASRCAESPAAQRRAARTLLALWLGVSMSALVMLMSGALSTQLVLVSEGVHSLADSFFYAVTLYLHRAKYAAASAWASAAARHQPFGLRRLTVLGGFFSGCFLAASCLFILLETLSRIAEAQLAAAASSSTAGDTSAAAPDSTAVTFISGGFGLLVNVLVLLQHYRSGGEHGHAHSHAHGAAGHSHRHEGADDANVHGALLHAISDVCTSLVVLACGALRVFTRRAAHLWIDAAASTLIVGVLMASARSLLISNGVVLLQHSPVALDMLRARLRSVRGVLDVSKLYVWQVDDDAHLVGAATVVVDATIDTDVITQALNDVFFDAAVLDTTIQVTPATPS